MNDKNEEREFVNKILILTKNILAEQQLQGQLQLLNYEVFCSTDIYQSHKNLAVFSYFPVIMLSETIADLEVENVVALVDTQQSLVVRLTDDLYSEEEETILKEKGVNGWVSKSYSNTMIRETLALLQNSFYRHTPGIFRGIKRQGETFTPAALDHIRFSKTEKRLFSLLLEHQTQTLSRKEICAALWRDGETSSNQSQLSCIVAKIKNKLKAAGYEGETLITKWGKGYSLDPMFCRFMQSDQAANVVAQFNDEQSEFNQTPAYN